MDYLDKRNKFMKMKAYGKHQMEKFKKGQEKNKRNRDQIDVSNFDSIDLSENGDLGFRRNKLNELWEFHNIPDCHSEEFLRIICDKDNKWIKYVKFFI